MEQIRTLCFYFIVNFLFHSSDDYERIDRACNCIERERKRERVNPWVNQWSWFIYQRIRYQDYCFDLMEHLQVMCARVAYFAIVKSRLKEKEAVKICSFCGNQDSCLLREPVVNDFCKFFFLFGEIFWKNRKKYESSEFGVRKGQTEQDGAYSQGFLEFKAKNQHFLLMSFWSL